MTSLNKKLWRDFLKLKAQTFSLSILIICGVSLLVAAWSSYSSLKKARDSFYEQYVFADVFTEFKRSPPDVLEKIKHIDGVQISVNRIFSRGLVNLSNFSEPTVGIFISVPSDHQAILNRLHLREGRLPRDGNELEAVVHEAFANRNGVKVGDEIEVIIEGHSEKTRIVGIGISPEFVYALSAGTPLPDDRHFSIFWMTDKRLQRLMSFEDSYNSVVIKLSDHNKINHVMTSIDDLLKPYGSLGAYARARQISNIFVEDEITEQKVTAIFLPFVFLGIATFLINVIASRLIHLQRPQIATLKALGFSKSEVAFHYLKLIFSMTLVGSLLGLVVGTMLGKLMSNTYQKFFHFPDLHFSINGGAFFIGLLAGTLPALIGSLGSLSTIYKMAPAEAMKPETPKVFKPTIFESVILYKFEKYIGARHRMILRNLLVRPLRLFFIVFSLSASLSIVITAGSWSDMVDNILSTQFQRQQREDLSVNLLRPHPIDALQEISGAPGVMAVEGYRVVPIKLSFQNYFRELVLTGWPTLPKMRNQLDKNFDPIKLDREGLYLSRFFAKNWGVKTGDLVQLKPLEGTHKEFLLPVVGFTDDLMGISANIKIEALWKLLNEEPRYNQMTIKADPRKLSELYIKLKEKPEIFSINLKASMYQGFRTTFGQVMNVTISILMLASLLISLGIIYNSIRVSFSERSWELAGLRVLGFKQQQISAVLLWEVGIQVCLSLIPGCFLGWWLAHLSMKMVHTEAFDFPVIIERSTFAQSILAMLIAFMMSAFVVHRMSKNLNPSEALKSRE